MLGSRGGAPVSPYYVDIDGYDVIDVEPVPDPVSHHRGVAAAAAAGEPAGRRHGRPAELLQFTSGSGWQPLGPGTDPAYPG